MKFYPRDWRGDQALRAVSIAARGLWMECLCLMHEAKPYGHLLLNGKSVEDAALARMTGVSVDEVSALMSELREAGAFSATRDGVIFSRRMTKDHARASKGRKAVQKRWAQPDENNEKSSVPNSSPTRDPITQKPETRDHIEKQEPNGSSKKNRGTRLPADWVPDIHFAASVGLSHSQAINEATKFKEWWPAQPGQKGVKLDWDLTWKTWCRKAGERQPSGQPPPPQRTGFQQHNDAAKDAVQQFLNGRRSNDQPVPSDAPTFDLEPGDFESQSAARPGQR